MGRHELGGRNAAAAALLNTRQQPRIEAVPASRGGRVEAVRVPEDGECSAVLGRPVEQSHELGLGAFCRQSEVALIRERGVHRGERNLDEVEWLIPLEAPRPERAGDPGAKADRIRKPERRVVAKPRGREGGEIPVRVHAEVVVAVSCDRAR